MLGTWGTWMQGIGQLVCSINMGPGLFCRGLLGLGTSEVQAPAAWRSPSPGPVVTTDVLSAPSLWAIDLTLHGSWRDPSHGAARQAVGDIPAPESTRAGRSGRLDRAGWGQPGPAWPCLLMSLALGDWGAGLSQAKGSKRCLAGLRVTPSATFQGASSREAPDLQLPE